MSTEELILVKIHNFFIQYLNTIKYCNKDRELVKHIDLT